MIEWLLGLPRFIKRVISVCADIVFLSTSIWVSVAVTRQSEHLDMNLILMVFCATLPLTIWAFVRLGLYRAVVRFIGRNALLAVFGGIFISTTIQFGALFIFGIENAGRIAFVYMLTALLSSGGSRLLVREFLNQRNNQHKERVLIYGAGSSGRQLAQALMNGEQYHPVTFVDDDVTLQRSTIMGIPVGNPQNMISLVKLNNISRILLAIPSVNRIRRREVLDSLDELSIPVQSIPGMRDLVDGSMRIDELQDVKIEDLLGRDPVTPKLKLMNANIFDKVVMVTGAGGSIGSELCRQIARYEPKVLVLFESSEFALYSIERELAGFIANQKLDIELKPILGNVQHRDRMESVMRSFGVNTVYHAAAYKHVPLVEFNVVEGIRNNVFGTWHAAEAAVAAGVKTFVLISTDKAVRPTKRLAELVLQALSARQRSTRFCMVRFGNVLGSSGSVVPLFREQIRHGGPITVTHRDIIRYFMTIPEAAQLVIQAGAMGKGGDVFVLDMGDPVSISELAVRMIHLMGLEVRDEEHPDGDIEIVYTGLRPGEKLFEELLVSGAEQKTEHSRIMSAQENYLEWDSLRCVLDELSDACECYDQTKIRSILVSATTGFNPTDDVCDLVWHADAKSKITPFVRVLQKS
jgi:FlaA1/EpsC-like NDP-sugar epimerase